MAPLDDGHFATWSGQHLLLLAITAVGAVVAVAWGRRHRGTPGEATSRRAVAAVFLLFVIGMQVYWLLPEVADVGASLPLQLSDLADYTAVYALWTRGRRTAAFTYYVGLTLTLSALLTPSLGQSFPDPRWFGFWIRHMVVVWTAVYLVWGLGIRPTWRLLVTSTGGLVAWAVIAYPLDRLLGTDYGYLVAKPAAATPLDWLGPWPWYVLIALVVLLAFWALVLTLPWVARSRGTTVVDRRRST